MNRDQKIEELLTRGVEEIIEKESLVKKLKSGKKLRIKLGIDPTGPKIHIGRATQLWKLRAFQELGHKIVLIIGDFTAQIGDASDKDVMRKPLTKKEVETNMKNYKKQIGKILDIKKVEFRYNSEWLNKLSAKDLVKLSMIFTAQQMIQRRNFKERWDAGKPIGLHELDYPIFQGYDSVTIKADVEIGGIDQLFNVLAGREIQRALGQTPQDVMVLKMLNGLDGRKMSTSWGNIITIIDEPQDMFGKIMSMKDELMLQYFELCTLLPLSKIEEIKRDLANQKVNPRDVKAELAGEIVSSYHGKKEAEIAKQEFNKIFREKQLPSEIKEVKIERTKSLILDLLVKTKIAFSKSEAKRLIIQKGIKIDGKIEDDWRKEIEIRKGMTIQAGKRRFIKII